MKKLLTTLCLVLLVSCSQEPEILSDKLVERQGITYEVNSQTPFTGSKVSYHENGQLEYKGNYKNGEQDGLVESYHKNGQLYKKENYKDGEQDGLVESYYENGQLQYKGNRKDGEQDGLIESYYENGQLQYKGNRKDGEQDGLVESYYENGQLQKKENYKDGKLEGVSEIYNKSGKLVRTHNFTPENQDTTWGVFYSYHTNGKLKQKLNRKKNKEENSWLGYDGTNEEYYDNGQLSFRYNFFGTGGVERDLRVFEFKGKYEEYYEDGTKKLITSFTEGILDGPFISYHPDGTVKEKKTMVTSGDHVWNHYYFMKNKKGTTVKGQPMGLHQTFSYNGTLRTNQTWYENGKTEGVSYLSVNGKVCKYVESVKDESRERTCYRGGYDPFKDDLGDIEYKMIWDENGEYTDYIQYD